MCLCLFGREVVNLMIMLMVVSVVASSTAARWRLCCAPHRASSPPVAAGTMREFSPWHVTYFYLHTIAIMRTGAHAREHARTHHAVT